MHESAVALSSEPQDEVVDAMAELAQRTGLVIHVVAPRKPGVVPHARDAAASAHVHVDADLRSHTVRVRFARR
jgi:hypothetical protein